MERYLRELLDRISWRRLESYGRILEKIMRGERVSPQDVEPLTRPSEELLLWWARKYPGHFNAYSRGNDQDRLYITVKWPWYPLVMAVDKKGRLVYLGEEENWRKYRENPEDYRLVVTLPAESKRARLVYLPEKGWVEVKGLHPYEEVKHPATQTQAGFLPLDDAEIEAKAMERMGLPAEVKELGVMGARTDEQGHTEWFPGGQLWRLFHYRAPEEASRLGTLLLLMLERGSLNRENLKRILEIAGRSLARVHRAGLTVGPEQAHLGNVNVRGVFVDLESAKKADVDERLGDLLSLFWAPTFKEKYPGERLFQALGIKEEVMREFAEAYLGAYFHERFGEIPEGFQDFLESFTRSHEIVIPPNWWPAMATEEYKELRRKFEAFEKRLKE